MNEDVQYFTEIPIIIIIETVIQQRLVFTSDGIGVVIRSVERYNLVKKSESEAEH